MHLPFARVLAISLLAAAGVLGCSSGRRSPETVDDFGPVADFSLTERSGRIVRRDDLLGKVCVAAFTFTRCAGACSQISAAMARLQQEYAGEKDVVLVSFSVDPEHDTPEVAQGYSAQFGADAERWLFLTGDQEKIYRLIEEGFHLAVEQRQGSARTPGNEVLHSPRLAVVDRNGHVRGYYDGRQVDDEGKPLDELPQLRQKIAALLREKPDFLPTLNAVLNGLSALLLMTGYLAIRRRWVATHKTCMLAALGVSTLFLVSYLYYHFHVRGGEPTRFQGEGWIWRLYLAVLLSHTVLAAVVPFLAVYTAYLGLRDRLARHVRLARWTLPIWLYVSVTGVVVYWMLYRW